MAGREQVARFTAALVAAVAGSAAEPGRNFRVALYHGGPSFTCPACGAVSHHPDDAREGYCGRCHDWTGEPA